MNNTARLTIELSDGLGLSLTPEQTQSLMNEMWLKGIRPDYHRVNHHPPGSVTIAFKPSPRVKP